MNTQRTPPADRVHQLVSLDRELFAASAYLKKGLGELQRIDGGNDFYHLPLTLLSTAFERLAKAAVCFGFLELYGRFPTRKEIPAGNRGHDLKALLAWLTDNCFDSGYLARPAAQADLEFLANDPVLGKIVASLSDFGLSGRYYHLDVVMDRSSDLRDPADVWRDLELSVFRGRPDWPTLVSTGRIAHTYPAIIRELVIPLERMARAICRLFTLGPLGDEARRFQGHLRPFLFIRDDELGQTDYRDRK